jgi:hypothetical protein
MILPASYSKVCVIYSQNIVMGNSLAQVLRLLFSTSAHHVEFTNDLTSALSDLPTPIDTRGNIENYRYSLVIDGESMQTNGLATDLEYSVRKMRCQEWSTDRKWSHVVILVSDELKLQIMRPQSLPESCRTFQNAVTCVRPFSLIDIAEAIISSWDGQFDIEFPSSAREKYLSYCDESCPLRIDPAGGLSHLYKMLIRCVAGDRDPVHCVVKVRICFLRTLCANQSAKPLPPDDENIDAWMSWCEAAPDFSFSSGADEKLYKLKRDYSTTNALITVEHHLKYIVDRVDSISDDQWQRYRQEAEWALWKGYTIAAYGGDRCRMQAFEILIDSLQAGDDAYRTLKERI